jgi:hypothetical protein
MSGPAIHYIVGTMIHSEIRNRFPGQYDSAASGLVANQKFVNFGTLGPDFLFFNSEDMPAPFGLLVGTMQEAAEFIQDLRKMILELVPEELVRLKEELDQLAEDAAERSSVVSELQQTANQFKQLTDAILSSVTLKIEEHITDSVNIFEILSHPIQGGDPQNIWWWFDTLHYRRTGDLARELIQKTKDNPQSELHAYALGYLSHVACDVVGHPYVNMICGGPYRTHPQRHKITESFNDVWAYDLFKDDEFTYSNLYQHFDFGADLPQSLSTLISDSVNRIYGDEYGSPLGQNHVNDSYKLWLMWFKNTTTSGLIPEPIPYSITAEVQEDWQRFQDNVGDVADLLGSAPGAAGGGLLGFFAALAAAILAPLLLAAAVADFLAGTIVTLGTSSARYFISLAYQSIYDAFKKYRLGVAMNGLAFPLREHLDDPTLMHLNDPTMPDSLNNILNYSHFPTLKFSGLGNESHLVYPISAIENMKTTSAPYTYATSNPAYYVNGNVGFNRNVFDYVDAVTDEIDPISGEADSLNRFHADMRKEYFGNAQILTAEMYNRLINGEKIPNFSLDADRGIGYKAWAVEGGREITGNTVNLDFTNN